MAGFSLSKQICEFSRSMREKEEGIRQWAGSSNGG